MAKKDLIRDVGSWDEIDEISKGLYSIPQRKSNIKIGEVRKYCKKYNKEYSDLTEREWEKFRTDAGMLMCAE